jgi:Flp pilus assembly protein TadG
MMNRHRDSRGQSMVEFALILPVFVLLLVGILDVGRAVYSYNTINNAAREGARWAIVDQTVADIQDAAAAHSVGLDIPAADVQVQFINNATGGACASLGTTSAAACSARVTVPFEYEAATPLLGNLLGVIQMTGQSQFQIEMGCPTAQHTQCPLGE